MKLKEREAAIKLRNQGYALNEIAQRLGIAKSTASLWVRDVALSPAARARIEGLQSAGQKAAQEIKRAATKRKLAEAEREAHAVVRRTPMSADEALIVCALMYWCEGEKSRDDKTFTFSNSDPELVRAFMSLLRTAVPLDETRFRMRIHLHEYHDEGAQRKFWSRVTGIPEAQCGKTYWKPHTGKTIKPGYPGCVHLSYYDVRLARKIAATARVFLQSMV
jgi:transcriptional regulator with XRE-family HTH domain